MKRLKIGFLVGLAFAAGLVGTAVADLNYTQGSGTVLFDFLCFSTKHCSGHVNINSAGTEIGTLGAPIRTDPTGTTIQPVSGNVGQSSPPWAFNLTQILGVAPSATNPLWMQPGTGAVFPSNAAAAAYADGWDATQGSKTDVPCTLPATATACSRVAIDKALANAASSAVPIGSASGGWQPSLLNALTTTVRAIKNSAAGQLGLLQCSNSGTTTLFIQIFDAATTGAVTLGSTTPKLSFEVPPGAPSGYALSLVGIQFSSGIQAAATTTATGNTAPSTLPNCNAGFN